MDLWEEYHFSMMRFSLIIIFVYTSNFHQINYKYVQNDIIANSCDKKSK